MVVKPQIRGNICLNAHPVGLAKMMENFKRRTMASRGAMVGAASISGKKLPKTVLVLGCSMGYGLASRMTAAFSCGADTVGVSYENEPTHKRPGSPGWYNNRSFDFLAKSEGLYSATLNADAFSDDTRKKIIELAKRDGLVFDEVIYSLASPVRTDPKTGIMYRSAIKPIGKPFIGKTIDLNTYVFHELSVQPATEEEIEATVKVMGGEDWELWIQALDEAGILAHDCTTLAYSYIGPAHSWPIYRDGTIGRAKAHLEATAKRLNTLMQTRGGHAYVSINKALVTRSSAVIPVIPLYISALYRIMKEMHLHEDCTDQIIRLYRDRLLAQDLMLDGENRIRMDDWEMRDDVQKLTATQMIYATEANLMLTTDILGFKTDFLQANGFDVPGVDYHARVQYD